jgi:hypothetical protein
MRQLPKYVLSITGPGDPVWDGKPSVARAARIVLLTGKDSRDRQYYRDGPGFPWERLSTARDYARLNWALDIAL